MYSLDTPIQTMRLIGPATAKKLEKLQIRTIGDLLFHIPHRYIDYSHVTNIRDVVEGEDITVQGTLESMQSIYTKSRLTIQKAVIADATGKLFVVWYNQPFLKTTLLSGMRVALSGKISRFGNTVQLESPAFEIQKEGSMLLHTGRIVPVYKETDGISSKALRRYIHTAIHTLTVTITEILPSTIRTTYHLLSRHDAFVALHFPTTFTDIHHARRTLAFEELFLLQLTALYQKHRRGQSAHGRALQTAPFTQHVSDFLKTLPFSLTHAQETVLQDIMRDIEKPQPMNRLLLGDVGSGKTILAVIAVYLSFLNKTLALLMAPTEILAQQHAATLARFLTPHGISIALHTSSHPMKNAQAHCIIGTHALLSSPQVSAAGLVIIDEQHRFGVLQRKLLTDTKTHPHVLTMTATPIPRTLARTIYADLDISLLDMMPLGRKSVKTWVVPPHKRSAAYEWIKTRISNGEQIYILCPFIEESESQQTVKAAKQEFDRLTQDVFPHARVALLHGKLKSSEKQRILSDFRERTIDILVATPVIEVGIDVPTATVILIEGAERFGLAQLHQLRGRVGRGQQQSYCLLFTETDNAETLARLQLLTHIHQGPLLAEQDMQRRGIGELFGIKQHGKHTLKVATLTDHTLLTETKKAAEEMLELDPTLMGFPLLLRALKAGTIDGT